MFRDLRFALRNLHKHRRLSLVVVATLMLGIGISSGVFAYLDAVILRPQLDQGFDSYAQVYTAYTRDPLRPATPGDTTLEDFLAFRERSRTLQKVAAWSQVEAPLGTAAQFEVRALLVSEDFFALYDLDRPLLGRLLQREDFTSGNPVIVLGETVWRNRFAADPNIVGRSVNFNGQPVTVVGITPVFAGMTNGARAWIPYPLEAYFKLGDHLAHPGESAWLNVAGRLSRGSSRRDVAADLRLIAEMVINEPRTIQSIRDQSMDMVWKLTGLISLICVLAVLLAVTGVYGVVSFAVSQRTRELGIRLALGAQRRDIYRTILSSRGRPVVIGLVTGLLLSVGCLWGLAPLLKTAPFAMNIWDPISYGITGILLAGITLLAMIVPARRATKLDPLETLRYE